ncbi:hypothetical protein K8Q98_01655 [Candidatus Nomurabacteria bacterium]|nr:hypothetical protein [Candidatus Nomurabacteria bacterium]
MSKKHIEKYLPLILLGLVLLAIVLGSVVYNKYWSDSVKPSEDLKIDENSFSADEQKLLVPPGPNATKEEVDEHSKLAAKLSVVGSEIEVKDCKVTPLVLQASITSPVVFKNTGSKKISISFDENNVLEIGVGKSISANKAFIHGRGLYGYLCKVDDFTGLVGYIIVTP